LIRGQFGFWFDDWFVVGQFGSWLDGWLVGGAKKTEMSDWKDRTIEAYQAWTAKVGIVPGQPKKVEHKHIVTGVSLIGAAVPQTSA